MIYEIAKATLKGSIAPPPSKSYTHRAIICASLAKGISKITNYLESNDTNETIWTLNKFGIAVKKSNNELIVPGRGNLNLENLENKEIIIDTIKESGSTLRFFIPIACVLKIKKPIIFVIKGRLKDRPIVPLLDALTKLGAKYEISKGKKDDSKEDSELIAIEQGITGGKTEISGNISSQFITGLLLACPMAENDTEINLTTEIESMSYIKVTLNVLNDFGIRIDVSDDMRKFKIPGNQHYKCREFRVESDYSSAAFLLAAGAINGELVIKNLNGNSEQGDREILNILKSMNAKIEIKEDSIKVKKSELKGITIDAKNIPDLVPICAVLGCFADGETKIINAGRLRIKESDRLNAIATELKKMNADIEETKDGLIIKKSNLKGAEINPHNDHRIAMSCAIAGLSAEGKTIINNAECVNKSYPSFFEDINRLRVKI